MENVPNKSKTLSKDTYLALFKMYEGIKGQLSNPSREFLVANLEMALSMPIAFSEATRIVDRETSILREYFSDGESKRLKSLIAFNSGNKNLPSIEVLNYVGRHVAINNYFEILQNTQDFGDALLFVHGLKKYFQYISKEKNKILRKFNSSPVGSQKSNNGYSLKGDYISLTKFTKLAKELQKQNYISTGTTNTDLKAVLSGTEPFNKINWIGEEAFSEAIYFFLYLIEKGILVPPSPNRKHTIIKNLILIKNKEINDKKANQIRVYYNGQLEYFVQHIKSKSAVINTTPYYYLPKRHLEIENILKRFI